jgi:transcriptional regulator with XRE-family HTH domain
MSPSVLIREARRSAKLTQAQLADRLRTTQPVIARLEHAGANPTLGTLERALDAAGYRLELHAVRRSLPAVDETQIIERLRLTPAERLAAFTVSRDNLRSLRDRVRRA